MTISQNLRNSNGNTFSFIPHVCYFSYHPWIAASEGRSLTTQQHQHPCPIPRADAQNSQYLAF